MICKFCGFLSQVKATRLLDGANEFPTRIPSAAWGPQHDRIMAGIFHGLYLVGFRQDGKRLVRIDFVPPHVLAATPELFEPRKPLKPTARRAGWTGYAINLSKLPSIGMKQIYGP